MKLSRWALVPHAVCLLSFTVTAQTPKQPQALALVGGTVVDLREFGRSDHDLRDAVVIIRGDRIERVGSRNQTPIPRGAKVIDCKGRFILPGLVDGFAGMNSQAQANATLYMGVTTIVGSQDDRRGLLKFDASPSPHLYLIDSAGSQDDYSLLIHDPQWSQKLKEGKDTAELSPEDTALELEATAKHGTRAIWLGHNLTSANVKLIIERCRRLGLPTYGEFISTPYQDGLADGVDVLLHMTRYELGLVPEDLRKPLIADPEGAEQKPAYDYILKLDPADDSVAQYAGTIKAAHSALMPTFSLEYLQLPDHRNLWKEPAAAILNPKGMFFPSDPATGEPAYPSEKAKSRQVSQTAQFWAINRTMFTVRPVYLAASGASVFGAMPGISMHTELELLVRLGLSPREALAAATSNYEAQFGWHELGLVEPGRRADVLVLSADPTLDITNSRKISDVVLGGTVLNRDSLLKKEQ